MKSLTFLLVTNCFTLLFLSGCSSTPKAVKPNIVIILADDLGYGGIGCYGNTSIKTPNLDYLADQGIKFTDFHSNAPVCSPTRAALLTGNYQQRSGIEGVVYASGETREVGLDTHETVTIAELMKINGYATGIMGKWHLGYKKEFNPVHHGFDEFYGYVSGNVDYHSHYDGSGNYDWWHNLDSILETGYTTDLITEHAVEFIDRHKKEPFFLYIPHEAPHLPFQGRNDPAYRLPGKEFNYQGAVKDKEIAYKEMIEVMDEGIGKIMETLKKNKLEENTLVIFLSDNGAEKFGDNGNLNGDKGSLLEGGHRVPAIVYWKAKISRRVSSETLMGMDLLPTILSVTNTAVPSDIEFDGTDFSNILFGDGQLEERTSFWRYRKQKAVRKNKWKLLISEKDTMLYDLEKDIEEMTDIAPKNSRLVKNLTAQLQDWEREVTQGVELKTK